MSKKNRTRRRAQAGRAGSAGGRTGGTAEAVIDQVMSRLWAGVASGDPLRAELETATCLAVPLVLGTPDRDEAEAFISTVLVDGAVRRNSPDGAALLRVLMSLGSPRIRREASQALAELTADEIYPPQWVTDVGKVTPGQAWRRNDVFGDEEVIAVTFSYGEDEHGLLVQVDLSAIPVATAIAEFSDSAALIEAISTGNDETGRTERISLAEARRQLIEPLDRAEREPDRDLSARTAALLPVARSRVRRLPAAPPGPVYTAADRAAAVDEFMKSPLAVEAVAADKEATRFWAEVLTGYSSRIPGEPPGQVGPLKLTHILLGHVPGTFVLSPAQRAHLEPAVTAWLRWSAARRELGNAATETLTEALRLVLGRFDRAYDDPDAAAVRGYAAGLAASDADVAWLSGPVGRRMAALPLPPHHGPVNLADPADRRQLVRAEFGGCSPPPGMTGEEFVDAAYRVVEDLWRDDGPTSRAVGRLLAGGVPGHDAVHRLAGTSVAR